MPSGILGASSLSAAVNTTVYTVAAGKLASFAVSVCNRTTSPIAVRLAVATSASPTTAEWLEYDAAVPANGVLERSGLIADATKQVVAYALTAGVSVVVYGYED
jgi:hypothetical protein